jgi:endogenous inhibitor of DNA gyrase (YacG/DUF329 family)
VTEADRKQPRARRRGRGCPICGKPPTGEFHPFCSRRCADVDLNRWLSGAYVIPGAADESNGGAEPDE